VSSRRHTAWSARSWSRIYRHRMSLGLEKCRWCKGKSGSTVLTFDHIVPLCEGGSSAMHNVTIMCFGCNKGKANKPLAHRGVVSLRDEEAAAEPEFRWSQFPQQWDPMWHPENTPKPDRPWQYDREPELVVAS
jgi:hypothetical protein